MSFIFDSFGRVGIKVVSIVVLGVEDISIGVISGVVGFDIVFKSYFLGVFVGNESREVGVGGEVVEVGEGVDGVRVDGSVGEYIGVDRGGSSSGRERSDIVGCELVGIDVFDILVIICC